MKKAALLFCLTILVLSLTACSSEGNVKLTDEESDAIAQYCAYLLLKYDNNKNDDRKLLDVKELQDIYKERKGEDDENTEDKDLTPTPTSKPPKDDEKATPTPTQKPDQDKPTDAPTAAPTAVPDKDLVKSLTKLYSADDFKVEYKSYETTNIYEHSGGIFRSKDDNTDLMVVNFEITNTGSSAKKFDYENYPIDFELLLSDGQILKPHAPATILILNYLIWYSELDKIPAGKTVKAVLVFDIAKQDESLGFTLRATNSSTGKIYEKSMK